MREEGICYARVQLKLARTRAEMLSLCQRLQYGTRAVNTREGPGITTPVDLNILLLQGEEDDQGADGNGAAEGRRGDAEGKSSSVWNL